jgi:hypothetical protein
MRWADGEALEPSQAKLLTRPGDDGTASKEPRQPTPRQDATHTDRDAMSTHLPRPGRLSHHLLRPSSLNCEQRIQSHRAELTQPSLRAVVADCAGRSRKSGPGPDRAAASVRASPRSQCGRGARVASQR